MDLSVSSSDDDDDNVKLSSLEEQIIEKIIRENLCDREALYHVSRVFKAYMNALDMLPLRIGLLETRYVHGG